MFDYILYGAVTWWSIGLLSFSFIHYFFGFHYLYKELFSFSNEEAEKNRITYD